MWRSLVLVFVAFVLLASGVLAAPEARIVGGKEVDIIRHPYLVSIRFRRAAGSPYYHECAGCIYSSRAVLTAAQCFSRMSDDVKIIVVAGANTRTGVDGKAFPAAKWIVHDRYSIITVDYDIGILILDEPLELNGVDVDKISIRTMQPAPNRFATIAGWGYREEFGPSSNRLEEARVPIVSQKDCKESYDDASVTDRMICAGFLNTGGIDACSGDTGGPLVIDNQLVGLVSWGRGCARPGFPTVYTSVSSHKQWIDDTIAANV